MTDQELDRIMERVLIDSLKLDWEKAAQEEIPFKPSSQHQRQMRVMLANPLKWVRRRERPVWKRWIQRVAVILLVAAICFGSLMAFSPTARAAVLRWVTEWYDTHITYRYEGESLSEEMPHYDFTALPEGYVEDSRVELPNYTRIVYVNSEDGTWIWLRYIYMRQGSVSDFLTENAEVIPVTVNGLAGQLFLNKNPEHGDSTVTWIDPDKNLQFAVDAYFDKEGMLRLAESVSLIETEK